AASGRARAGCPVQAASWRPPTRRGVTTCRRPALRRYSLERRVRHHDHARTLIAPRAVGRFRHAGPAAQVVVVPLPALRERGFDLGPWAGAEIRAGLDSERAGRGLRGPVALVCAG